VVDRPDGHDEARRSLTGDETHRAHVVVVDDRPEIRDWLARILEDVGHRVTAAADGPSALDVCRRDTVEVLITDLSMTPMSGRELIETLRRDFPVTVPVVLTGFGTVERAVDLMRLGAFDVLSKPCRPAEIRATVERSLEHHTALRSNEDLRERLRVQEKLAMIGKLAAGVAHELNNPLDGVLRCVRLVRDRVNGDAEGHDLLDMAESGLQRMADIVQGLLAFSRHAAVEQAPQSLEALVEEAATATVLALGDAAPPIRRDVRAEVAHAQVPRGMHQVLVNLLRNACDAGGRDLEVTVRAFRDGEGLVLQVLDHGPGISATVMPRVFEPFFTTKDPGKGTGLGLPISARLVEKFGGTIRLECPPEGGTTATVTLPSPRPVVDAVVGK
jgi:signal transduction histidine kinase